MSRSYSDNDIRIVVFDCDGVLFNSGKAVMAYYDFVFERFGLPRLNWSDPDIVRLAMMNTNEGILRSFISDESKIVEMMEFASRMNFRKFLHLMQPMPGIFETLRGLASAGYINAVFTNRGSSTGYLLDHFDMGRYFSHVVTSFDVSRPKPAPEGLFKIMNHFGVTRQELLFIGDSMTDYLAARSAGVRFLAYPAPLEKCRTITHHHELLALLS